VLAELGQGLRSVLVEAGEHGEGCVAEAAFGAFAAEAAVQASDGRAYLPTELFALDQAPGLPDSFTLDDVVTASKGHAIGRARLDGTYEIR
jgi:hypothetical protein